LSEPEISIVIPARNEGERLKTTIASAVAGNTGRRSLEFVIVDDASHPRRIREADLGRVPYPLRVIQQSERQGVGRSRNRGCREARGTLLFITDAHIGFPRAWPEIVLAHAAEERILAAAIRDETSRWRGYGCSLVVPYMGTRWNIKRPDLLAPVHVASAAGTILPRALFDRLGGYDEGMLVYGGAEPEFSVRAWLAGAQIACLPGLAMAHRFQPVEQAARFLHRRRTVLMHNNLRFGLLYLGQAAALQMLRHYAMKFPRHIGRALHLLDHSDVWTRRTLLQSTLRHDFDWFIDRFDLKDQIGLPIYRASPWRPDADLSQALDCPSG
jgi:glycosyltransferase involved in cell wall biosynthesis